MRYRPTAGAIFVINIEFLYAAFLVWIAWLVWPETREYWGFGILSGLMGLGGFLQFITTLGHIRDHLRRDRSVRAYAAQGESPKGDRMADITVQRKAGMID